MLIRNLRVGRNIFLYCWMEGIIEQNYSSGTGGHFMNADKLKNLRAINSLTPGRPRCHFKTAIFNLVLLFGIFTLSNDNALRWMPWNLTDDKSTLVQVMAWCRQATSHYLSQCWPSSMSPYGVTRLQWVKLSILYNKSFQEEANTPEA